MELEQRCGDDKNRLRRTQHRDWLCAVHLRGWRATPRRSVPGRGPGWVFSEEWLLAGRRERLQISKRIAAPGGSGQHVFEGRSARSGAN